MSKIHRYTPQEDQVILDYVEAAGSVPEGCQAAAEELNLPFASVRAHYYDMKRKEREAAPIDLTASLEEFMKAVRAKDDRIKELEAKLALTEAKLKERDDELAQVARSFEIARRAILSEENR